MVSPALPRDTHPWVLGVWRKLGAPVLCKLPLRSVLTVNQLGAYRPARDQPPVQPLGATLFPVKQEKGPCDCPLLGMSGTLGVLTLPSKPLATPLAIVG